VYSTVPCRGPYLRRGGGGGAANESRAAGGIAVLMCAAALHHILWHLQACKSSTYGESFDINPVPVRKSICEEVRTTVLQRTAPLGCFATTEQQRYAAFESYAPLDGFDDSK